MRAVFILSLVSFVKALPASIDSAVDYGYWDVNITAYSAASGYRGGDVYAEYSRTPGKITHSTWVYSPEYRNTTATSDDPTFTASQLSYSGDQDITIHQVVDIDGADMAIVGTGRVTLECGLGGAGRGCAGATRVMAGEARSKHVYTPWCAAKTSQTSNCIVAKRVSGC